MKYNWGDESKLKLELAKRISVGRKTGIGHIQQPACKIVTVVMGDNMESAVRDIEMSLNLNIPIIIVRGSEFSDMIIEKVQSNT